MTTIAKEDVKRIFEERIKRLPGEKAGFVDIVDSAIDFFEKYKIEGVDSQYPEEDRLVFQYGIFDLQDGKGENFTLSMIREFMLNPEVEMEINRSELHIVFYYNKEDFAHLAPFSASSDGVDNMGIFKDCVITSEGFTEAKDKTVLSSNIFMVNLEQPFLNKF